MFQPTQPYRVVIAAQQRHILLGHGDLQAPLTSAREQRIGPTLRLRGIDAHGSHQQKVQVAIAHHGLMAWPAWRFQDLEHHGDMIGIWKSVFVSKGHRKELLRPSSQDKENKKNIGRKTSNYNIQYLTSVTAVSKIYIRLPLDPWTPHGTSISCRSRRVLGQTTRRRNPQKYLAGCEGLFRMQDELQSHWIHYDYGST